MSVASVGQLIEDLAGRFAGAGLVYGHGTDSAWDEATALVLGVTGLPNDRRVLEVQPPGEQRERIESLARRRIRERVPLPYLLGEVDFAGFRFRVQPGVVIPRSPIGQLIRTRFEPWLLHPPATVADVCSGSGCIGIAIALTFPDARVDLIDVAAQAIELARENIALHALQDRVRVHRSDLFEQMPAGCWDLVVSNPPYVDQVDMRSLPPEYRYEPALGLEGGEDGLDLVARLLEALPARLCPEGLFICEVGGSAPALLRRFPQLPFVWPDLPEGGEGVFLLSRDSLVPDRAAAPCA